MSDSALFAGSWLLTFLLHSTVWLGGAWLLLRWLSSASPAAREWIWKGATVGALLSPTLQLTAPQWFQIDGIGGRFALGGVAATAEPIAVALRSTGSTNATTPEPSAGTVLPPNVQALASFIVSPSATPSQFQFATAAISTDVDTAPAQLLFLRQSAPPPGTVNLMPMGPGVWPEDSAASNFADVALATATVTATSHLPAGTPQWLHILVGLWILGAVFGVSFWAWRLYSLKRQLNNRMPLTSGALMRNVQSDLARFGQHGQRVRFSVSDRIHVPIAFGLLRGEVCLPMRALHDLDGAHQRSMICHELAHLRRRDPLWITFYNIVQRVLFLQPLLIIARREAMHAAEELCDSWASDGTGNRFAMAECLTQVADWLHPDKRNLPVACMAQATSPLQRRVERLLNHQSASPNQARAGRATSILVALLLAMALIAPGVASHFAPTGGQTVAVSVNFFDADLNLAQARIQYLQTEIVALEQELILVDPNVGGIDELRRTLDHLRQQLSLLQQITLEISRDLPANFES